VSDDGSYDLTPQEVYEYHELKKRNLFRQIEALVELQESRVQGVSDFGENLIDLARQYSFHTEWLRRNTPSPSNQTTRK
jgi:hypothetical protein